MSSLTTTPPAEPFAEAKTRLAAAVERARPEIVDLSHRIHGHPEPAFEEAGGATTMRNNSVLVERFRANMAAYGIADEGDDPICGSTDMANVSQVCPAIHPDLAIAQAGTPGRSIRFRDAAATPRADETTLLAATLTAQTAYDLFADPDLVAAAWREFREAK